MAGLVADQGREAVWRGVLGRFSSSGLSVRAFCRRERLTEASFYAWRRTIAQRDAERAGQASSRTMRALPRRTSACRPPPAFLPAVVTSESSRDSGMTAHSAVTLELAGGRVLRLSDTMSVERLVELVCALEARRSEAAGSERRSGR